MPLVKKDDFTEVYVESDTEQEPKPPPAEPRPQINTERNIKGEIVSNLAKVEDEGEGAEGVEGAEGEGEGKEKKKKKKPRKKKKKAVSPPSA